MFCGECGAKNKKGSAFCEKCGSKLEVEEEIEKTTKKDQVKKTNKKEETKKPDKKEEVKKTEKVEEIKKEEPKKERKPISKKNKIIIGIVAIVVAILVAGYMYLGSLCKPEKIAIKYFKAYTSKDADKIANIIKLDESDFVSKKLLKEALKDEEKIELENYAIDNTPTTTKEITKALGIKAEDDMSKSIRIKYIKKGSSKEYYKTIKLVKSKNKKYLFFDNWVVDSSDLIAKDYSLSVPADSKVSLNGIELGKKYKKDNSSSYDSYLIPSILKGTYKAKVTLKSGIELTGTLKVDGNYGSFSSNNLKFESKTEKKFVNEIKENISLIYNSVLEDKSFEDIKDSFDEDSRDNFENTFNTIKQNALSEYSKLKEIKITNAEIRYFNISEDNVRFSVQVTYDYKVEYKNGEETKEYSKTGRTTTIYVTYKLDNKSYKLSKIESLPTYFSHYSY